MSATLSNYALLLLRLLSMVFVTRGLFLTFSAADYGFWALLWSVFAYALLLDFGLGTALQKYTSQWRAGHGRDYSALLSTSLLLYTLMGIFLALGTWGFTTVLRDFLPGLSDGQWARYQQAFTLFGVGTALLFPTGCFTELLRGLEAIVLRNALQAVGVVLQLLLTLWALHNTVDPLMAMVWISLGTTAGVNLALAAGFFYRARHEKLRLSFARPRWQLCGELLQFSLFAWMITLTNLIIFRTDQLVISGALGLGAVAGYQIIQRVADMYRQYTTQLHDVLAPQVARYFQQGDHQALKQAFLSSNRWVFTLVLWSFLPLWFGLPVLLNVWLGLSDSTVILSGRILLFSMALQVVVRSTATQVMLMCQRERALMGLALAEALGNLILSLYLVQHLGIVGVALGTLIPNVLVTLGGYFPLASRFLHLSMSQYLSAAFQPVPLRLHLQTCLRSIKIRLHVKLKGKAIYLGGETESVPTPEPGA